MLLSRPHKRVLIPPQARTGQGMAGMLTKLGQECRCFQKRWSIMREWPEGMEGEEVRQEESGKKERQEKHITQASCL